MELEIYSIQKVGRNIKVNVKLKTNSTTRYCRKKDHLNNHAC